MLIQRMSMSTRRIIFHLLCSDKVWQSIIKVACMSWVNDITSGHPEIVTSRCSHIVSEVSYSPFLLNISIKHHLGFCYILLEISEWHHAVNRCLWYCVGVSDEQSAWELYSNSKEVFRSGSLNLWKFVIYQELSLQECINQVEWIITVKHWFGAAM